MSKFKIKTIVSESQSSLLNAVREKMSKIKRRIAGLEIIQSPESYSQVAQWYDNEGMEFYEIKRMSQSEFIDDLISLIDASTDPSELQAVCANCESEEEEDDWSR